MYNLLVYKILKLFIQTELLIITIFQWYFPFAKNKLIFEIYKIQKK